MMLRENGKIVHRAFITGHGDLCHIDQFPLESDTAHVSVDIVNIITLLSRLYRMFLL